MGQSAHLLFLERAGIGSPRRPRKGTGQLLKRSCNYECIPPRQAAWSTRLLVETMHGVQIPAPDWFAQLGHWSGDENQMTNWLSCRLPNRSLSRPGRWPGGRHRRQCQEGSCGGRRCGLWGAEPCEPCKVCIFWKAIYYGEYYRVSTGRGQTGHTVESDLGPGLSGSWKGPEQACRRRAGRLILCTDRTGREIFSSVLYQCRPPKEML